MKYCSKCSKCMTDTDGTSVSGISIDFILDTNANTEFIQKQLGKYEIKTYEFCYECWLDSLFGRKQ